MTPSEIIKLAEQAGIWDRYLLSYPEEIERFYHLAVQKAVQAEREACAAVCDAQHDRARTSTGAARADACAAAIRARKDNHEQN